MIGRINTIKAALNDSLTSDSLKKHFPTVAVTSSHQSADNFAIPATSCDTNPFTFAEPDF